MSSGSAPRILGLGGSDHDVHACILREDEVVVAVEEERLSRKKYGLGGNLMEGLARHYCLDAAGLTLADMDTVVADAILAPSALLACRSRARAFDHHLAHAACAWLTSGFERGAILVVDNAGGLVEEGGASFLQATSWYRASGREIERLGQVGSTGWKEGRRVAGQPYQRGDGDHSIGHFYKKISGALGYRFPHGAPREGFYFPEDGITMGLASFGDERWLEPLWRHVILEDDGGFRIVLNDGRLDHDLDTWLEDDSFENRAAVAAAGQEVLTRLLCHLVDHLVERTGETRLCLGGGVAMNSAANGEILRRTRVEQLYVPPSPGDNGTGLGAALWTASRDPQRPIPSCSVYGGRVYGDEEIVAALGELDPARSEVRCLEDDELIDEVAQRLADGQLIAWFEGGSENGRRALGHRSLLADPRTEKTRDRINRDVKRRQMFRPFAPVVPEERASELFAVDQPSPYMQIVFPVRTAWRERLAAVTHVDGSARLQTVRADQHPRWHRLLLAFEERSGVPVLLNTSFNGRGEPIVETPLEAVRGFQGLGIEGLVLENRLVIRR